MSPLACEMPGWLWQRMRAHIPTRTPPYGAVPAQSVDFIAFALAAAHEALTDAGLLARAPAPDVRLGPYDRDRVGVAIGCGVGAIDEVAAAAVLLAGSDPGGRRLSPFFVPRILVNMAAGNVSIAHRLRGPNVAPATACATGAHAIGDAFRLIKHGDADAMLAGGTEACITPVAVAGAWRRGGWRRSRYLDLKVPM